MSVAASGPTELPLIRYLDLAVLALAAGVFLIFGFPMLGYAVAAGAWLAQRGIQLAVARHAAGALAEGRRRAALGAIGAATLGRVWLVALAVLLVGLADREAGLSAAVLSAALFTVYFGGEAVARLLGAEQEGP